MALLAVGHFIRKAEESKRAQALVPHLTGWGCTPLPRLLGLALYRPWAAQEHGGCRTAIASPSGQPAQVRGHQATSTRRSRHPDTEAPGGSRTLSESACN